MVATENIFSPSDLMRYPLKSVRQPVITYTIGTWPLTMCLILKFIRRTMAEMLVKESLGETNSYSWLKARHIRPEVLKTNKELEKLMPIIQKMTSENCAKVAVKLDNLTDGENSAAAILATFRKLLQEQYSIQLMELNVKSAKERRKNGVNRVHPELVPVGRLPIVSFILQT